MFLIDKMMYKVFEKTLREIYKYSKVKQVILLHNLLENKCV